MAAKKVALISGEATKSAPKQRCQKCQCHQHPGRGPRAILTLAAIGVTVAAVVKELKQPADQRTWNGMVASAIPYDFRIPTLDRIKQRLWDPEGRVVGPRIFGVGWTVNVGRVVAEAKELAAAHAEEPAGQ